MYPYKILFDITLYDLLIAIGLVVCLFVFRKYADRIGLGAKLQNLVLFCTLLAVALGYGCAVLMQSVYSWIDTGVFQITGATFYGGLLGGAGVFLLVYFVGGRYVYRQTDTPFYPNRKFFRMADIAVCSVAIAHAFGRLGCLSAGCCYGITSEKATWWAWKFQHLNGHAGAGYALPTQFLEALFLFVLFIWLSYRVLHGKTYNLSLYMIGYGVWRFLIEYLRADYRGKTIVPFLTPSQLIALLLIVGGVVVWQIEKRYGAKHPEALCDAEVPKAPLPEAPLSEAPLSEAPLSEAQSATEEAAEEENADA